MIEKVAGSNPCWNGGRIFFSGVDFLCWLLFRYPFHPRVTAVARKKSRSFCQKCRWQVTAKTRIHLTYVDFIEPCFGIGHSLSLICQMTSEDIKHQLIIINVDECSSITMQKMHAHTHTHIVQTDGVKGQCCLAEIFWEEKCLEFAFERMTVGSVHHV